MMRMRTKTATGLGLGLPTQKSSTPGGGEGGGGGGSAEENCEMRPGGMLVQTRCESDQNRPPPPTIRVRVKYGSAYREISISSVATFGELKKMLTGPTGLHHEDQKLIFKDKERDSKAFLDTSGVKNKSKMVLIKDPISQEKRYLEMRKAAKLEKATKFISAITLEVDKLAGQVVALESVISKGGRVAEKYVLDLIGLLMDQLLKLDEVIEDVDAKVQMEWKMQVRRVQNYVETLDKLKLKNSMPSGNEIADIMADKIIMPDKSLPSKQEQVPSPNQKKQDKHTFGISNQPQQQPLRHHYEHVPPPVQQQLNGQLVGLLERPMQQVQQPSRHSYEPNRLSPVQQQEGGHSTEVLMQPLEQLLLQPSKHSTSAPVVITTQWETFDSFPVSNIPSASTTSTSVAKSSAQPGFNWDLLL